MLLGGALFVYVLQTTAPNEAPQRCAVRVPVCPTVAVPLKCQSRRTINQQKILFLSDPDQNRDRSERKQMANKVSNPLPR